MTRKPRFTRFAAIDWSGAVGERHAGIAVAMCDAGAAAPRLVRPDHRWSRAEVLDWMLDAPAGTLIGLDLGLSLPFADRGAFFPGWSESPSDARGLWALVERLCADDAHFSAASFVDHPEAARHFRRQGRALGDLFEPGRGRLRVTEVAQRDAGLNPYSNLNLVGAAQVGKASLTGMRLLHRLQHSVPIWPFDPLPASGSVIVEIYTSLAALAAGRRPGRSKMRDIAALNEALSSPEIASAPVDGSGPIDDHSSDALLAAAWLRAVAGRRRLWEPPDLSEEIRRTEGWTFGIA